MIAVDKILHFVAGLLIAIIVGYFFTALWALAAGLAAGALKEALDEYRYGGADIKDFLSTALGTLIGMML